MRLPWLGCCVRLPGLCFLLFPVLSPTLTGMPCPPPWFCLSLVSGLVSQLASHVGWDAVSVFWVCLQNFICDFVQLFGVYGGVIFSHAVRAMTAQTVVPSHFTVRRGRCPLSAAQAYRHIGRLRGLLFFFCA